MGFGTLITESPWLWEHPHGPEVDLALKWTYVATAGVELTWLFKAFELSSRTSDDMRYTPVRAVLLMVFPAVNVILGLSVIYDLWRSSGAPPRSRLLFFWWGFWTISFYYSVGWYLTDGMPIQGQVIFVGSTLCFLIVANLIADLQITRLMQAEAPPKPSLAVELPPRAGWSLDEVTPVLAGETGPTLEPHTATVQRAPPSVPAPVVVVRPPRS